MYHRFPYNGAKSNYNNNPNYNYIVQETTSDYYGKLHLGSYNAGGYTNQLTIVGTSGNVGIGTTSPATKLEVLSAGGALGSSVT